MDWAARAASVPLLALRVTGVYGPGDPHASYGRNAFARSLVRDRSVRIFGAGEEERDHIFVDDVAAIAAGLLRTGAAGVYNLAHRQSRAFGELAETIRGLVPYGVDVANVVRQCASTHRPVDLGS